MSDPEHAELVRWMRQRMDEREWTISDLARRFGVSRFQIAAAADRGDLRAFRTGADRRVRLVVIDEVEQYVAVRPEGRPRDVGKMGGRAA